METLYPLCRKNKSREIVEANLLKQGLVKYGVYQTNLASIISRHGPVRLEFWGIPARVHEGFTNEKFLCILVLSLRVPLKRPLFQQFGETDNYDIGRNFSHIELLCDATIIQK